MLKSATVVSEKRGIMSEEFYDEDGFRLCFEDDTSDQEKQFFMRAFPNVNKISERKVHCTSCYMHIGTAPISEAVIRMHPVLRVTHCRNCHTFYNSGEFDKGEDGSELYCRWCGQGGEVYCCSKCPYVFCKKCIVQNLSRACVQDISRNDNWQCFSCAPKIMWHLRAQHWALINYIEKQKKEMKDKNLSVQAINNTMKLDSTTCCSNKGLNKKATTPVAKKGQKRASDANEISSPGAAKIPDKRPSPRPIVPAQPVATPPPAKKAKSNDEVVCTPDILSMFMSPEEPPPLVAAARPAQTPNKPPVPTGAPIPSVQNRQVLVRPAIPNAVNPMAMRMPASTPVTTAPPPVYHTINGYRIDLHTAAQQGTYRLPNGKLIQVRKQAPAPVAPSPVVQSRANVTIAPKPMFNPAAMAQNPAIRMTNGAGMHLNYALQQQQQIQEQRLQQQRQQQQQQQMLQQQRLQQPILPPGQPQPTIVAGMPNPALQLPTLSLLQSMVNGLHEDTPLGRSRKNFEGKLLSGVEICQHIVSKINTLTNSNSFKNIRNVRDLKELYIHVSYLLTYAIGRFKTLQEKCVDDVKNMGFTKESDFVMMGEQISNRNPDEDKSDDEEGDCEIIEQCTTLIEIDSEDEEDTTKKKNDGAEAGCDKALNASETEAAVAAIMEENDAANTSEEQISMADFLHVSYGDSPEKAAPANDDATVVAADSSTEKTGESSGEKKDVTDDDLVEVIDAPEDECSESMEKSESAEAEAKQTATADDSSMGEAQSKVSETVNENQKTVEAKEGTDSDGTGDDSKVKEVQSKVSDSAKAEQITDEAKESAEANDKENRNSESVTVENGNEVDMKEVSETTSATERTSKSSGVEKDKVNEVPQPADEQKAEESTVVKEKVTDAASQPVTKEKTTEESDIETAKNNSSPAHEDATDGTAQTADEKTTADTDVEIGENERNPSEDATDETPQPADEEKDAPDAEMARKNESEGRKVESTEKESESLGATDIVDAVEEMENTNTESVQAAEDVKAQDGQKSKHDVVENKQENQCKAAEELEDEQCVSEEAAVPQNTSEECDVVVISSSESLNPNKEESTAEDNKMEIDGAASELLEAIAEPEETKINAEPATEETSGTDDKKIETADSSETMETDVEFATASSASIQSEPVENSKKVDDVSLATDALLEDLINRDTITTVQPIEEVASLQTLEPSPTELFAQMEDSLQKVQEIFESTGEAVQDENIGELSEARTSSAAVDGDTDMAEVAMPEAETPAQFMDVDEESHTTAETESTTPSGPTEDTIEGMNSLVDSVEQELSSKDAQKENAMEKIVSEENSTNSQESLSPAPLAQGSECITNENMGTLENINFPEQQTEVNGNC